MRAIAIQRHCHWNVKGFDGGYGGDMGAGIAKLLKGQTEAVGFGGLGVMPSPVGWIGTESGLPGEAETWSTGSSHHGDPNSPVWMPKAADTTLQTGDVWFYEPGQGIRELSDLINVYHQTVGRNAVLEMDFAIDRTGRVDPAHTARYTELGNWIRGCYGEGKALAETDGRGGSFSIALPTAAKVDRVVLREDQAQGQRIRSYTVEAFVNGAWAPFSHGDGVGNRRVDLAAAGAVSASALRLNISQAIAEPVVMHFGAYAPCPSS